MSRETQVSERVGVNRGKTSFTVTPEYIECLLWVETKKGFTPRSSPFTSRRTKKVPPDGVPQGMEGGVNPI